MDLDTAYQPPDNLVKQEHAALINKRPQAKRRVMRFWYRLDVG
jgi:hypothetical protein